LRVCEPLVLNPMSLGVVARCDLCVHIKYLQLWLALDLKGRV
jgi:hypothetical protein